MRLRRICVSLPVFLTLALLQVRAAAAEGPEPPPEALADLEPVPAGEEPPPLPLDRTPRFLGEQDDDILDKLCHLPVREFRPLGGGASITLRAVLSDGSQAAVKPEQARVTRYQSEVAAYRVSRALNLGMVSPSCVRTFPRAEVTRSLPRSLIARMDEEVPDRRGQVNAAVIHWIPDLHGLHLERLTWWQPLLKRGAPFPQEKRRRLLEISTQLLFDFLVANDDRWSGGNTNEVPTQMVFLDQGAAFGSDRHGRREHLFGDLRACQRFSREVAESLRDLDLPPLLSALRPLLTRSEIDEFQERVQQARRYLSRLQAESPADSFY